MAYVCKTIDQGTGQCVEWADAFVLPPLTAEQGREVAALIVPVLVIAAALRIVREFILSSHKTKE